MSQVLYLEVLSKFSRVAPRDHEHAIAAVVDRSRVFGRGRGMRLDDLQNEEAVCLDKARIDELALEVRVTLTDERRLDLLTRHGSERKLAELVDVAARGIADADHLRREVVGRYVDDAFPALVDHVEAVIFAPDVAADERGLKPHDHVPTHGHDVCLATPCRADEHDGARLQKAPNLRNGKVFLVTRAHGQ